MRTTALPRAGRMLLAVCLLLPVTILARGESSEGAQRRNSEGQSRPITVYRLEFVVDETVDGRRLPARRLTMLLREGEPNRVRMGSKVYLAPPGAEPKPTDIGLKFDCELDGREGGVLFDGKLDLNEVALAEDGKPATPLAVRNFQAEVEVLIPLDKPTTLGVYEDAAGRRSYELRATVTVVK